MDNLDFSHGPQGIIISGCILLAINLFIWMASFIFNHFKKRSELSLKSINELSMKLTEAINTMNSLKDRIKELEEELKGFNKLKDDMRRMKLVIKKIAKDQWEEIKELFYDDD